MKRYLLDSTPLAAYLHGRPAAVKLITPWIQAREVATSQLCYAEVVEYIKGFPHLRERQAHLRRLLKEVVPYSLTYGILERYADIRRVLRPPQGKGLIGDIDTLIAATALEQHLTLVTTDSDFERVPQLKVMLIKRDTL
jgi:predicted nucleic acid-binding protein